MSTLSNMLPRWTTNRDTRTGQTLRGLFGRPAVALASLTCIALIIVAIFAPWLAPQDPYNLAALDLIDGRLPPGARGHLGHLYVLGSDALGRDMRISANVITDSG